MRPSISVIIPVYNVEAYLAQCLESVIAQNFTDFEIIGVNDMSEDHSVSIFQKYSERDNRLKLIHHSENLGLPSARNSGIAQASGDYLFFLDSDDWISPHALKLLIELVQKDNVDIAMGGVLKCYEETGMVYCQNHANYMDRDLHAVTVFDTPKLNWAVISWNKLIRRDFIQKNNLVFSPEPRRFEDMLTYKWYLSGAKVSLTTDITYFYRQRSSITAHSSIMQANDISVLRDKFLAYADITSFLIDTGYFNSEYDPLNSKNSSTNLHRALSWIIPEIVNKAQHINSDKELVDLTLIAFKKLCNHFPAEYVNTLPNRIKKASEIITNNELEVALTQIINLY